MENNLGPHRHNYKLPNPPTRATPRVYLIVTHQDFTIDKMNLIYDYPLSTTVIILLSRKVNLHVVVDPARSLRHPLLQK